VRVTFARTGFPPALAIATDGDAGRFGIADGDGTFIQLNYVIALHVRRGWVIP
jgi:phosphomannomutase